ncbi:amidase [Marivibrio halodurans]|uniref:Amidase n=1 Tax=Marivibrio halodurans TaxID=2039722 RepID=A0A8J7S3Z9_9PROT|nr:amidase family protein [Marivibrio halodurans]MBP5858299.1 amidase [Marivibrio halodurans]
MSQERSSDPIHWTACQAVDALADGEISPHELIAAAFARIEAVDDAVNALPTRCRDRAEAAAEEAAAHGPLHGLPVAVKDLNEVAGVRCTFGSPIYRDYVPETSDIMVEVLEGRGALTIAKSNTPEFGAGANTFNEVLGVTRNPWNTDLTCGGSSGGSAVALATGQCWLATGSDLGGSLRTPAGYCQIVGMRPSPGTVPRSDTALPFGTLAVEGPMARNVEDVGLMLDAMAGQHPGDPISRPPNVPSFRDAAHNGRAPRRVGFSEDLGILPVDPRIRAATAAGVRYFEDLGATVEEAAPDFTGAAETFQTLRAAGYVAGHRRHLAEHRDLLKPDVIWNIEKGMALTADDIAAAEIERAALYRRFLAFFETYDLFCCPVSIVPPFPVEQRYVAECDGHRFDNYVDWLAMCSAITLTGLPAISVPCGRTEEGLPVGLQLVGPPHGEALLLGMAKRFEEATGLAATVPIDPRPPVA